MTVAQLIARLKVMPQDMDVCVSHGEYSGAYEIEKVYAVDDIICVEGNLGAE